MIAGMTLRLQNLLRPSSPFHDLWYTQDERKKEKKHESHDCSRFYCSSNILSYVEGFLGTFHAPVRRDESLALCNRATGCLLPFFNQPNPNGRSFPQQAMPIFGFHNAHIHERLVLRDARRGRKPYAALRGFVLLCAKCSDLLFLRSCSLLLCLCFLCFQLPFLTIDQVFLQHQKFIKVLPASKNR